MSDLTQAPSRRVARPSRWAWPWRHVHAPVYVALTAVFLLQIARFYDPHTGFTSLEIFGDYFAPYRLKRLHDVPIYTYAHSNGYDGQFYAQLAVAGNPFDPQLRTALDDPPYRSGRILLPEIAHLAALGRPAWVLNAYALSNVICWLILAWVMARWWFRPTGLDNLVRWGGVLFGAGMLTSVTRSLADGPALLCIALAVRALEVGRRRLAGFVFAASGLVREVSVIASAALWAPARRTPSASARALLVAATCVLPAAIWSIVLYSHYGFHDAAQSTNMGIPLVAILEESRALASSVVRARSFLQLQHVQDEFFVFVSLVTQAGFVLLRPQIKAPWWRVGAIFAVLALCRSSVGWEDAATALPRVYLPLTLAFNILVPRTRAGVALLLAGNLTVLSASRVSQPIPTEQTWFADGITCEYVSGWYASEHAGRRIWRWSSGRAAIQVHNPNEDGRRVEISFEATSNVARTITVRARNVQRGFALAPRRRTTVRLGPIEILPGDTSIDFETAEPPWTEPWPHGRALTFSLQSLRIDPISSSPETP